MLVAVSGAAATEAAFSNAQGYYVFLNIPPGEYSVKTSKKGLPNWKGQVSIVAGTTNRLDIRIGADEKAVAAAVPKKETTKPAESRVAEAKPVEPKFAEARASEPKRAELKPIAKPEAAKPAEPAAKSEDEKAIEQAVASASQLLSDADIAALEASMSPAEWLAALPQSTKT